MHNPMISHEKFFKDMENPRGCTAIVRCRDPSWGGMAGSRPSFGRQRVQTGQRKACVEVDDIAAAPRKARSLGATVMKDVKEVMNMGWPSIIMDPTRALLGL
jgi:predicted enzyme related to lactoylglutathione lyase